MSKLIPQMAKLIPQKLIPQLLTPRQVTPHQAQLAGFYRPNELTAEPPIEQYIVRSKIVIAVPLRRLRSLGGVRAADQRRSCARRGEGRQLPQDRAAS